MGQGNRQIISYLSLLGGDRDTPKWYITRMSSQIYPSSSEHLGFVSELKVKSWASILVDVASFQDHQFFDRHFAIHYVFLRIFGHFCGKTQHRITKVCLCDSNQRWQDGLHLLSEKPNPSPCFAPLVFSTAEGGREPLSLGFSDDGMTGSMKKMGEWSCDVINDPGRNILVFPKIGVPPNHPFNRVFHYKPSILGVPLFLEPPILVRASSKSDSNSELRFAHKNIWFRGWLSIVRISSPPHGSHIWGYLVDSP